MLQNNAQLKSLIEKLWQNFWEGGIANPLTAIEQITYLIFMKRLDDLEAKRERDADFTGEKYISRFAGKFTVPGSNESIDKNELRWSVFKHKPADEMLLHVQMKVFPFLKEINSLNQDSEDEKMNRINPPQKSSQSLNHANVLKSVENEQTPIVFNEVETLVESASNDVVLQAVKDIENVNALVSGQEIEINKNLTVVYGNNGTGKSGYIRLLNNAFYNSRGDKNILANVFNEYASGQPTCKFVFTSNGGTFDKFYPTDKNCFEFSQYSVFDTQSVKVHLDNDNQLNFTPSGFDFFEKILQIFEELKSKINAEINSLKKSSLCYNSGLIRSINYYT